MCLNTEDAQTDMMRSDQIHSIQASKNQKKKKSSHREDQNLYGKRINMDG